MTDTCKIAQSGEVRSTTLSPPRGVLVVVLCSAVWAPGGARAAGRATGGRDDFEVKGFTAGPGDELVASGGRFQGTLQSGRALDPGWHVFEAEYRTENLPALGTFNVDVTAAEGGQRYSAREWLRAASAWSPLKVYFKPERRGRVIVRFHDPKKAHGGTSLHVRDPKVSRFRFSNGVELIANGGFAGGTPGEFPSMWGWKYNISKDDDYRLVADKTFRTGEAVMRLTTRREPQGRSTRRTTDAKKKERTLVSTNMPLPTEGTLQLTFWARTSKPKTTLTGWLFGDGWKWQYMVRGGFQLTSSWKKYSCGGPCPTRIEKSPFFWARFDYHGEDGSHADLVGISVKWYPPGPLAFLSIEKDDEGAAEDLKGSVWMGVPGKNMIFNPGFELGWNGWKRDHWVKKLETTMLYARARPGGPVRGVGMEGGAGMEGGTALRLSGGTSFRSFCFPIEVGQTYTVSAYFMGEKPGTRVWWSVISPEWHMYADSIKDIAVGRWERKSFTFTWAKKGLKMRAYLRLDGDGALVDRVQVEKGGLSEYEPPPVTLGLKAIEGEDNILVRGREEARLRFVAIPSGALTGDARVELVVKDAWERVAWKREYTVSPGRTLSKIVEVPTERLGTFEVDMKAYGAGGPSRASGSFNTSNDKVLGISTARFAVIDPPPAERPGRASMFGVCYEAPSFPPWVVEREAQVLKTLGVHWSRFFTRFHHTTKIPPADYVAAVKEQVEPLNREGVEPIGCINVFPGHVAKRIVDVETPDPAALREYGEYVKGLVSRFTDTIRYWEIMNEPNLWRYRSGPLKGKRSVPPEKYIEILKVAYRAVKEVDPGLKVVGCCTNGTGFDWFTRCMELGSGRYMDVYSFHSYRSAPDMPDTYPDLLRLRGILDKHGFGGPMINSEQYFAADLYVERGSVEETKRGYYVRGHEELRAAGRTIRNFIHHAAAGVPYCSFAPHVTTFSLGGGDPYFLLDLFGAQSAATRFLENAGRGEMLEIGASMRVFVFPEAEGGPLVTVHSPSAEVDGRMNLKGGFTAFDIMGNRLSAREVAKGIPVRTDPCYVRYPPGTSAEKVRESLLAAEVMGLGDPFAVQVSLSGEKELTVSVSNRHNKPLGGRVVLQDVPEGWTTRRKERTFTDLEPGRTERMAFRFDPSRASGSFSTSNDRTNVRNLGSYPVTVLVDSGEEFVRREVVLSPLFAHSLGYVRADGDLSEWRGADWIELGGEHLSKDFNPLLRRAGSADLSARLACGWSAGFFALAVEVTDDRHVPGDLALEAWKGDSLQIYFDQKNNASAWIGGRTGYDRDDVAYAVSLIRGGAVAFLEKAGSERYIGQANLSTGVDKDVDVAVVRRAGKTVYEVRFPKKTLPDVDLREGGGFGFSLLINDNDGKGRKVGLTLAPRGKEPYNAPHEFKDLLLVR